MKRTMTTNTPKSIDTHYNGYKFRSRLETRWAVFIDKFHISYFSVFKGKRTQKHLGGIENILDMLVMLG